MISTNYCRTSTNANPRQLISLGVQINEGLYFRSPRLATGFESNAANIAKVLVKALLNLITKFNIQENQVVKNSQDHISSAFF